MFIQLPATLMKLRHIKATTIIMLKMSTIARNARWVTGWSTQALYFPLIIIFTQMNNAFSIGQREGDSVFTLYRIV